MSNSQSTALHYSIAIKAQFNYSTHKSCTTFPNAKNRMPSNSKL